ncbi:hypothetical protein LTR37_004053 [Vermiconidia calcicola]|uniref:Uncharacterized protein n=1 Tax=Vermiconidia calcicola TaxID=1690605 RepID=A0ACC3NNH0_9PEZI|nr:hypothetical protein LTR37_004053 [Vermiconidia calcicola]
MLDNTWPQYIFIRICVFVLQWIGPICFGYTAWTIGKAWPALPAITAFRVWGAAESVFMLFFLWYRTHLQREATHPPPRSEEERRALFAQMRREVYDLDKFMSGWFRGAKPEDIGREDMKHFLNWAFWDGRADMTEGSGDWKELEHYVDEVEAMMRRPFRPGCGAVTALRLTIDPIDMECRTLFWYFLMLMLDMITHCLMRFHGYQYFKTTAMSLQVWPPRPATWIEPERSPASTLSHWIRPHTSKTRLPILYIHGIGIGLIPHVDFLHELDAALNADDPSDGEIGILIIELLQISSRITKPVLTRPEFLRELTEVLDFHKYDRFVLASHSYGSVLSTHILNDRTLASRVSATLLIDPVSVLLHMPDVAYNFTIRPPKHAKEWQLWYFASKDPGVAHTLGRHFFWSENALWRDRIMELVQSGTRVTASLAGQDLIVDTEAVGTYLTKQELPDPVMTHDDDGRKQMELQTSKETSGDWKQKPWRGKGLEVIWWEGLDHGSIFERQETRAKLVDVLVEYSRGS